MKLKHLYEAMALKKQNNVKTYHSENVEIMKNLNLMIIPYTYNVSYRLFALNIEMPPNLLKFITTNKTSSDGQKNTEMLKQLADNEQINEYFDEILLNNIAGFLNHLKNLISQTLKVIQIGTYLQKQKPLI